VAIHIITLYYNNIRYGRRSCFITASGGGGCKSNYNSTAKISICRRVRVYNNNNNIMSLTIGTRCRCVVGHVWCNDSTAEPASLEYIFLIKYTHTRLQSSLNNNRKIRNENAHGTSWVYVKYMTTIRLSVHIYNSDLPPSNCSLCCSLRVGKLFL